MYALIKTNLKLLSINDGESELINREALDFLKRCTRDELGPFEIIFFDPPYAGDYEAVLDYAGEHSSTLLTSEGILIVEHHRRTVLPEAFNHLKRYRVVKQGESRLSFYHVGSGP